jgi:hypothetical protein
VRHLFARRSLEHGAAQGLCRSVSRPPDGWLLIIFALITLAGVRSLSATAGWGSSRWWAQHAMLYTAIEPLDDAVFGGSAGWGCG